MVAFMRYVTIGIDQEIETAIEAEQVRVARATGVRISRAYAVRQLVRRGSIDGQPAPKAKEAA